MEKIFVYTIATFAICIAFFLFKKEKWTLGAWCIVLCFLCVTIAQFDWARGFGKTAIGSFLYGKVEALGSALEDLHKTMQGMKDELEEQQIEIREQQTKLTDAHKKVSDAQEKLQQQQAKLGNVELLVTDFYERQQTEIFTHTDEQNVLILELNEKKAVVYFKLKFAPIENTVKLKWHLTPQPEDSYFVDGNILTFIWGDSVSKLRTKKFYISYAADLAAKIKDVDLKEYAVRKFGVDGKKARTYVELLEIIEASKNEQV